MANAENVRSIIIHTLMSPAAQRINFTLGGITVDGGGLAAVATLIGGGNIGVQVLNLPPHEEARYQNKHNYIGVRPGFVGASVRDRAMLVHECVHALYDAYGRGSVYSWHGTISTFRSQNEAAAYVAEALFHIHSGARIEPHPLLKHAYRIADAIKGRPGARVPYRDEFELREAVSLDPAYRTTGLWLAEDASLGGV